MDDADAFWESCARRAMALQRCTACGRFRYPPRAICPHCLAEGFAWVAVRGTGTVYASVTVHHRRGDGPQEPYNVALIELDEGVRMWSNVVGCAPAHVRPGDRVRLRYDDVAGRTLPRFERA